MYFKIKLYHKLSFSNFKIAKRLSVLVNDPLYDLNILSGFQQLKCYRNICNVNIHVVSFIILFCDFKAS